MGRLNIVFSKKFIASSLTEVVVATSVLLLIFAISIATLNTVLVSSYRKENNTLDVELNKRLYQYKNGQLKIPLSYQEGDVLVSIEKVNQQGLEFVLFSVENTITKKRNVKQILLNNEE